MLERICIVQVKVYPEKGDLEANFAQLVSTLEQIQAAVPRVDAVITPECFLDGYVVTEEWVTRESIVRYAIDPHRSAFVDQVGRWAADNSTWFVLGCTRLGPEGAYNAALIMDRTGALAGIYDKVHCQTHDTKFVPGSSLPVFDSDFGPFGVMICADRRWPETVRTLALKGARIILNPTYGMHGAKNLRMMQTRSYESELFIAFTHPEQALITDPRGDIVRNTSNDEIAFAVTEVDLSQVDLVRAGPSAHLRDRQPEVYEL
jgi:predicted amidohydrolase